MRRHVLVINNENFIGTTETRLGSEKDQDNLRDTFTRRGFHVQVEQDLDAQVRL